jgi:hypothetical protein
MSLDQAWLLAKLWYGDRLQPDFRRPTTSEAERIFEQVGLRGPFWALK